MTENVISSKSLIEISNGHVKKIPKNHISHAEQLRDSFEKSQDFGRESLGVLLDSIKMPTQNFEQEIKILFSDDLGNQTLGILPEGFGSESFRIISTDINRESLGILRSDDFGKESLGILPQDLARESLGMSLIDFGKESLGILPIDFGRESLGLLQQDFIDTLQNENCFTRDSSNFNSILYNPVCEKESQNSANYLLDTSKINQADKNCADNTFLKPEINISKLEYSTEKSYSNLLDIGFVNSHSHNSHDISFNTCSLNGPSKIYSLPRSDSLKSSNYSIQSSFNNAVLLNTTKFGCIQRQVQSLSNPISTNTDVQPQHIFWGTSKSFHGELNINEEDNIHDSVFVDGNCATNKINEVSIFDKSLEKNTNILDSTPEPDWPDDLDGSFEKKVPIVPTEIVFNKINKAFPVDQNKTDRSFKVKKETKPKDAKEMLENLSAMWNSNHLSDSQKLEGQHLITSLAELLCKKPNSDNLSDANLHTEDSGHSSIIEPPISSKNENHQCYEVLDLRKSSINIFKKSDICEKPLDLSLKGKFCRSQSVTTERSSSELGDEKKRHSSLNSLTNHEPNISTTCSVKNKEKSIQFVEPKLSAKGRSIKKGPLKAVIPITEMRCKSSLSVGVTPTKINQRLSKRTSTPIREFKLKPMAASTPIPEPSNESREIKLPVTRTKQPLQGCSNMENVARKSSGKVLDEKKLSENSIRRKLSGMSVSRNGENYSLASKLSGIELKRRNTVHEIGTDNFSKPKRSNSIGKVTGLMTSLSKVRENLKSSPYFNDNKKNVSDNGKMKSSLKMKALGKENLLK